MSWCYPAEPPEASGKQARRNAAEMWHFFSWSKFHSRVQSPVRSVISFSHRHRSLQSLSLSPTSPSQNVLSPNSHLRHAVTTLIRRVSGSRQATMYNCRCNGELFNSSENQVNVDYEELKKNNLVQKKETI